ncbi:hypothetical protein EYC80_007069 [Monilinia laxa]|uniref:Uncharacterized protein n=1 Tax=Monilinia laxa TaxID=61186 RepID=A0A5N6K039_MONLA|nr:hypothetical protein EYC80_007069 [Monilinia laxa]
MSFSALGGVFVEIGLLIISRHGGVWLGIEIISFFAGCDGGKWNGMDMDMRELEMHNMSIHEYTPRFPFSVFPFSY